MSISKAMVTVCNAIARERDRQEQLKRAGKFRFTCADDIADELKLAILGEEFGEVAREVCDKSLTLNPDLPLDEAKAIRARLKEELIHVAAVSIAWLESMEEICPR